jgi:hypothetical protein
MLEETAGRTRSVTASGSLLLAVAVIPRASANIHLAHWKDEWQRRNEKVLREAKHAVDRARRACARLGR